MKNYRKKWEKRVKTTRGGRKVNEGGWNSWEGGAGETVPLQQQQQQTFNSRFSSTAAQVVMGDEVRWAGIFCLLNCYVILLGKRCNVL